MLAVIKASDTPKHDLEYYHRTQEQGQLLPQYQGLTKNPSRKNPPCLVMDNIKGNGGEVVKFPKLRLVSSSQFLPETFESLVKEWEKPVVVVDNRREFHAYVRESGYPRWYSVSILAAHNFDHSNLHLTGEQIAARTKQAITDFILNTQKDGEVSINTRAYFSKADLNAYLDALEKSSTKTSPEVQKATKALENLEGKPNRIKLQLPLKIMTEQELVEETGNIYKLIPEADHCLVSYEELAKVETKYQNKIIISHCHGGGGRAKQGLFNLLKARQSRTSKSLVLNQKVAEILGAYIERIAGNTNPWFHYISRRIGENNGHPFNLETEKAKRGNLLK